jgi:hypothetical protein
MVKCLLHLNLPYENIWERSSLTERSETFRFEHCGKVFVTLTRLFGSEAPYPDRSEAFRFVYHYVEVFGTLMRIFGSEAPNPERSSESERSEALMGIAQQFPRGWRAIASRGGAPSSVKKS